MADKCNGKEGIVLCDAAGGSVGEAPTGEEPVLPSAGAGGRRVVVAVGSGFDLDWAFLGRFRFDPKKSNLAIPLDSESSTVVVEEVDEGEKVGLQGAVP